MQFASTTPEKILWLALGLLVAGYVWGTWSNRRRSKRLGTWLQAGIGKLGGTATWRIIRSVSSGAQVNLANTAPPFRQVQINYALLTRELPPLWGMEYARGKRDLLVFRGVLKREPEGELEVLPVAGELRRKLDAASTEHPWHWQEGPSGLGIATRGTYTGDTRLLAAVRKFLDGYGAQVQRLSIRPARAAVRAAGGMYLAEAGPQTAASRPHFLLFCGLGRVERRPAAALLDAVSALARAAG